MSDQSKVKVLCVDDEPRILKGLEYRLKSAFKVRTHVDPEAALTELREQGDFAVLVSDLRMPKMSGLELLAQAREDSPDTSRVLLSGHADMETAEDAINKIGLAAMLSKPCPPQAVLSAVQRAAELHRLRLSERELLERTLHGSVSALCHALSLVQPAAFGRSQRIHAQVLDILEQRQVERSWEVRLASMLTELGCCVLNAEQMQSYARGQQAPDTADSQTQRLCDAVEELLAPIPRLEGVRSILRLVLQGSLPPESDPLREAVGLIRTVRDFDMIESTGADTIDALAQLSRQSDAELKPWIEALSAQVIQNRHGLIHKIVPVGELRPGMILAKDLVSQGRALLLARGHTVTSTMLARLDSLAVDPHQTKVEVMLLSSEVKQRPQVAI